MYSGLPALFRPVGNRNLFHSMTFRIAEVNGNASGGGAWKSTLLCFIHIRRTEMRARVRIADLQDLIRPIEVPSRILRKQLIRNCIYVPNFVLYWK